MNQTFYEFHPDGKCLRVQRNETEVMLNDRVIPALCEDASLKAMNLFTTPWGPAHLSLGNQGCYWTVAMSKIVLKTAWRMVSGIMVPNFADSSSPALSLDWLVPSDMGLRTLLWTKADNRSAFLERMWLFAFEKSKACYRLPLGNLYDDARCCLGNDDTIVGVTHQEVISQALMQLDGGRWNSDLWTTRSATENLFRFEPKADSFNQLPSTSPWQNLCSKIGTAMAEKVVL